MQSESSDVANSQPASADQAPRKSYVAPGIKRMGKLSQIAGKPAPTSFTPT